MQRKLVCFAEREGGKAFGLTDEEPANRRPSECKGNLFILPSEKEENKVNCASECIIDRMDIKRDSLRLSAFCRIRIYLFFYIVPNI